MASQVEVHHYQEIPIEEVTSTPEIPHEKWNPTPEQLAEITQSAVTSVPFTDRESFRSVSEHDPLYQQEGVLGFVRIQGIDSPVALLGRGEPHVVSFEATRGHPVSFPGVRLGFPKPFMQSVIEGEVNNFELADRTIQELYHAFEQLERHNPKWTKGFRSALRSHGEEVEQILKKGEEARIQRERQARNQPIRLEDE